MITTSLREIPPSRDAKLDAQVLEKDRNEVRDQNDEEQGVAELGSAREIGGPIAGIHVTDRNHESGSGVGEKLAQERGILRHADRAVGLGQTW